VKRHLFGLGALALTYLLSSPVYAQAPGMPDPRAMSGIARVDPQLPAGQVTVRCLNGSFAEPAIGLEVTLELTGPDGTKATKTATSVEQGRATFTGLEAFVGGQAIAKASFDGREVSSQPIPLAPNGGSRLLLVKGAGGTPGGAPPIAAGTPNPHGGASAPNPHGGGGPAAGDGLPPFGEAFPLPGRPAGTVVVGALVYKEPAPDAKGADTSAIEPKVELEIELFAVKDDTPEGEPGRKVGSALTDKDGRVSFKELQLEEGEKLVAQGQLEEGKPAQRSKPFRIDDVAKAVVLVDGRVESTIAEQTRRARQARQAQPAQQPRGRMPLPPVQRDAATPANAVRVAVMDGEDKAVAGQAVSIVRIDASGVELREEGQTGPNGVALVQNLRPSADGLFFVEVIHDGAPYKTSLFELPEKVGARATLRVFPRTSDATKVKSAVHFELDGLENDKLRLLVGYEILVEGDAAYWPDGGLKVEGPEGVTVAKPMPESSKWLEEVEGAPYAKLKGPLAPGEVAKLSMAYVLPHDGEARVEWTAPFPLMQAKAVLKEDQDFVSGGNGKPPEVVNPEHASGVPLRLHELQVADASVPGTQVAFAVDGFLSRPAYFKWIAIGGGMGIVLIAGLAVATAPRRSRREELLERQKQLHARLDALQRVDASEAERAKVVQALELVYRQLDALDAEAPPAGGVA
jgi:5-hydroxyisourate hydrolase-like protein (transthyretin family)